MSRIILLLTILLVACSRTNPQNPQGTVPTEQLSYKENLTMSTTPTPNPDGNSTPTVPIERKHDYRMLSLGDSYTIGESVAINDRWPVQLAAALRQQCLDFAEPTILARTGWTTSELANAIQETVLEPPFDLVTLLIGVNNQYRSGDSETYRGEFASLLDQAIEFAGDNPARVLVLSIPDWGATPFGSQRNSEQIALEIDRFNQVNQEEAKKRLVNYLDITRISRQAVQDPSLIAQDGLHPSGKMYAEWVKLALPVVLEMSRNWQREQRQHDPSE